MSKDRRHSNRVTSERPLTLQLSEDRVDATLRNISLAGVSCHCSVPFPEMSEVQIHMTLPPLPGEESLGTLEAVGAVVRCHPMRHGTARRRYEVAIYFTELSAADRETLQKFVHTRLEAIPA